ncbi:MAG: hypothetical protein ACI8S6_005026, partial [Myxococcota bacterium]
TRCKQPETSLANPTSAQATRDPERLIIFCHLGGTMTEAECLVRVRAVSS